MASSDKIQPPGYFACKQQEVQYRDIARTQRAVVQALRKLTRGLHQSSHPLEDSPDLSHLRHNDQAFWALITAERGDTSNRYDRYGYFTGGQDKTSPIFRRRSSPIQHALVETRSVLDITQEQWAAYLGVHWHTLYRAEAWNTAWTHSPHVDKLINLDYVRSALWWLSAVIPSSTPSSPTHAHIPLTKHHLEFYIWCRQHGVPYRIGVRSESPQDQKKGAYRRESIRLARIESQNAKLKEINKRKPMG